MGFRNAIKQFGQNVVSEFITNKQASKGITDYDKWQEYEKISKSATPQQQQQINSKMIDEGVVDAKKYGDYIKQQAEEAVAEANDPDSDYNRNKSRDEDLESFRNNLQSAVKPSFMSGDKYKKEVLSKAVDELTKEYADTYDKVMLTYREYKDDNLMNEWSKVKGEYQSLINDSAKKFSEYIQAGDTYQDAYKKLIDNGRTQANRITQIQDSLRRKGDWAGIKGAYKVGDGEINPLRGLKSAWKTVSNVVSGAMGLLGEGVQAGKEALGHYEVLEELHHLGVYKDNEIKNTIGDWMREVFDGSPSWLPEAAGFLAGGEVLNAAKLPEVMTAGLKAVKLAPKGAKATKRGRFIAENMEDFLLYDSLAQGSMGRPMTDEDIQTNRLLNIPINLGLSRLVPTEWVTKVLPLKSLDTDSVSAGVLAYLEKNSNATAEDIAKAIYLDKAFRTGTDIKAGDKILEGVGGDKELFDEALKQSSIKDLVDKNLLTPKQVEKYNEGLSTLESRQKKIKRGEMGLDDMSLLDLGERIVKSRGGTLGGANIATAATKGMDRMSFISKGIVNTPNVHSKVATNGLNSLLNQQVITPDIYKTIVDTVIPEGSVAKILFNTKIQGVEGEKAIKEWNSIVKSGKLKTDSTIMPEIDAAYQKITEYIIKNLDSFNIPLYSNVLGFTYLGKQAGADKFFDIFKNQIIEKQDVLNRTRRIESSISKVDTYNNVLAGIRQPGASPKTFTDKGKPETYDITNTFKNIISDGELLKKQYVEGALSEAMKPFGITMENGKFTITANGLKELQSAAKQFEDSGWNVMNISKKQLQAYKIIFLKPYLDAVTNFKQKGKEFVTYFDGMFKELPDKRMGLDLKFLDKKKAGQELGQSVKSGFYEAEKTAAQLKTEDAMNEVISGMTTIESGVKGLLNQYEDPGLKQKILSLVSFVKDAKDKALLKKGLSTIIGSVLGDWQSNAYIKEAFKEVESISIYRKIISGMLMTDDEFSYKYLDEVNKILSDKGMNTQPLYEEIEEIRLILAPGMKKSPLDSTTKAQMLRILNKQQELFDSTKFEIPDSFYKQYDVIKTELNGKQLQEITASQSEAYAKNMSIAILDRYGVNSKSLYSKLYPKINSMIQSFKDKFPTIKLNTKGTFKGIGIEPEQAALYLDDAISMHALVNLKNQDEYEKYIFNHEAGHLLTYKNIEDNIKALADKVLENIKVLEELPENKGLDEILFYNKGTLDESMSLLNILDGDSTAIIQKLSQLTEGQSIPGLFKIIGNLEEAINEQQALYQTYKYISDKELIAKVKNKLELLSSKLDDNYILQIWKSFAGNKDINNIVQYMTALPKSEDAIIKPVQQQVKTIQLLTPQAEDNFKTSFTNIIDGVKKDKDIKWEETFDSLVTDLPNKPIATIGDTLDIIESSMSYIAGPYAKVIKDMFGNSLNLDVKSMYLGLETVKKREQSGKLMPFDIFATNKLIGNVLSSMGKYSPDVIDTINKASAYDIINQIIKSLNDTPEYTSNLLLKKLGERGIDITEGLSKEEQQSIGHYMVKIINNMLLNSEADDKAIQGLYKIINGKYKANITLGTDGIKQGEDIIFSQGEEQFVDVIDGDLMQQLTDEIVESLTDIYKLQYDVNLIGIDTPLKTIPYNSFLNVLGYKSIDNGIGKVLNAKWNTAVLSDVFKGDIYKSLSKKIGYNGIIQSFNDGLVKKIEFKLGNKTLSITKQNYDSLSAYELLNEFMDGLVENNKLVYELILDGKSYGIQPSSNFFNQIPGKLILEKLELDNSIKYLYSSLPESNVGLLDKEILQKIYDTFTSRKINNKISGALLERQQLLKKYKSATSEEIERLATAFFKSKKRLQGIDVVSSEDIKYIINKTQKGIKFNKLSVSEGKLMSNLQKYLYPKTNSSIDKFFDGIKQKKISIYTQDGFVPTNANIVAIAPKFNIIEELATPNKIDTIIVGEKYGDTWTSILDTQKIYDVNIAENYIEAGQSSVVNTVDGEFLAKIKNVKGDYIDGLAIVEGGKIKFIPMKDVGILNEPFKDVKQYKQSMNQNIKEVTSNVELIQKFLIC